jgi:hypothetical protein
MMGDRSDVDIVAGLEAGMETLLVLSGISTDADRLPTACPASSSRCRSRGRYRRRRPRLRVRLGLRGRHLGSKT